MRHRSVLVLVLAIVMAAAMVNVASAAKPTCEEDPTRPWCEPTTTTVPAPEYWTCQARVDNGAVWPIGTYDEATHTYSGDALPLCIDILEADRNVADWTVEWSGTTSRGTVKGLKLVFEEEVHATVFAEGVMTTESGNWPATLDFGVEAPGNMVFVAMPHSGDKWGDEFLITVRPVLP